MLEKRLTGVRRWGWLGAAIMGLGFTGLFGTLAIIAPAEFPLWSRLIFAVGALFGIGWTVLGIRVFWRKSLNLRTDTAATTGMGWGFVVFVATISMVSAPDTIMGLRMIVCSLVFLVGGAVIMIRHVVEQSELKTREKLLEIEYRLAELTTTVKPERPVSPPL